MRSKLADAALSAPSFVRLHRHGKHENYFQEWAWAGLSLLVLLNRGETPSERKQKRKVMYDEAIMETIHHRMARCPSQGFDQMDVYDQSRQSVGDITFPCLSPSAQGGTQRPAKGPRRFEFETAYSVVTAHSHKWVSVAEDVGLGSQSRRVASVGVHQRNSRGLIGPEERADLGDEIQRSGTPYHASQTARGGAGVVGLQCKDWSIDGVGTCSCWYLCPASRSARMHSGGSRSWQATRHK